MDATRGAYPEVGVVTIPHAVHLHLVGGSSSERDHIREGDKGLVGEPSERALVDHRDGIAVRDYEGL